MAPASLVTDKLARPLTSDIVHSLRRPFRLVSGRIYCMSLCVCGAVGTPLTRQPSRIKLLHGSGTSRRSREFSESMSITAVELRPGAACATGRR